MNYNKRVKLTDIILIVLSMALSVVLLASCSVGNGNSDSTKTNDLDKKPHFAGIVIETYEDSILVLVNEDEDIRKTSDKIVVSLDVKVKNSRTDFSVGDEVIVYHTGDIAESYPAQANNVYEIVLTSPDMSINLEVLKSLYKKRTPYVGDNNAVGEIISVLPRIDRNYSQRFFSIGDDYGTGYTPNTLTLYYEMKYPTDEDTRDIDRLKKNSVLLFTTIENLEEISYAFRQTPSGDELVIEEYSTRITHHKEDIVEFLEGLELTFEDFENNWDSSIEKMFSEDNN